MPTRRIYTLFALSGMCALIYQIVWTRWLGLLLGNFATAAATVVAVYMGGMAIGNALAGRFTARLSQPSALRLYALCEAAIAVMAFLSPHILSSSSPLYPLLASGPLNGAVSALACAVLLLPPTILMGATLPALVQAMSASASRTLGPLYAVNTLGAALGPLLAAFLMVPSLGLHLTVSIASTLNALVALLAFRIARETPGPAPAAPVPLPGNDNTVFPDLATYLLAFSSGAVALGFEISLTRLMVLTITGGSVYGFAIILSAFLLGLALGAFMVRVWPPAGPREAYLYYGVAMAVAWVFSLTTPFWDIIPPLLVHAWATTTSFPLVNLLNFAVITGLLLTLTTASGFALPALAGSLKNAGSPAIGRLFAFNTLGAVLGSLATGFVLLGWIGLDRTLLALGAGALLCSAAGFALAERRWRVPALALAPVLAALSLLMPRPDPGIMNAGLYYRPFIFAEKNGTHPVDIRDIIRRQGVIIYEKDGLAARITVRSTGTGGYSFFINGKPDGSTNFGDILTHFLPAHLTSLIHGGPENALVAGLGTGNTAAGLAMQSGMKRVRVVEIEPAVLGVARYFFVSNDNLLSNRKVDIVLDDARHLLQSDPATYDIIVSEPSNLFVSGMVNLYTQEYYRLVKSRLKPGGVFCQWIHYYRMSEADLKGAIRTMLSVFPNSTYWFHGLGDSFLIGADSTAGFDPAAWSRSLSFPAVRNNLYQLGVTPPEAVWGYLAWGPHDLERFSGGARICTDDFPYLEFTTPRNVYFRSSEAKLRTTMQLFQPLEPVPLRNERLRDRVMLGDYALASGNLGRALAEYTRARELAPANREIARKLAYIRRDLLGMKSGKEPAAADR
jgi:spermidine synthase